MQTKGLQQYVVVCWWLNVPATCKCISETDLLNFTCYHTETEVADQTFHLTHSMLTPGQPVLALTLYHQAHGWVATEVPIFKSLV